MIITKVRTVALDTAFPQHFAYLRTWYGKDVVLIAEIETDKGLVGRGGCHGPAHAVRDAVTAMTPWLIGANPLKPTLLRQTLYARLRECGQKGTREGLTGIYAALWEVKDKYHLLCNAPAAWSTRLAKEAQGCFEQDFPRAAIGSRWPEHAPEHSLA